MLFVGGTLSQHYEISCLNSAEGHMHSLTFAALIRNTESEVGYATASSSGRHVAQQIEGLYGGY